MPEDLDIAAEQFENTDIKLLIEAAETSSTMPE